MLSHLESARPWGYQLYNAVNVVGDHQYMMYIYDSEPLQYIVNGQRIPVQAYCGECTMISRSGMRWDSQINGDVPILYGERFIGFASFPKEKVYEAASYGYVLNFEAICNGFVDGYNGVKDMMLLAPKPFYLCDWIPGIPDDRPLSHRENYFSHTVRDGECYRNLLPQNRWEFIDVSISMIPTKTGSTAKPHIGVYAEDGMQIMELSARNNGYDDMLTYMWRYEQYNVIAEKTIYNGADKPVFKVEILGFREIDHS